MNLSIKEKEWISNHKPTQIHLYLKDDNTYNLEYEYLMIDSHNYYNGEDGEYIIFRKPLDFGVEHFKLSTEALETLEKIALKRGK